MEAPEPSWSNDHASSDVGLQLTNDTAGLVGVATMGVNPEDLTSQELTELTVTALLTQVALAAADQGHPVPELLHRVLAREPDVLGRPSARAVTVDGEPALAVVYSAAESTAWATIVKQAWVCVVCPSRAAGTLSNLTLNKLMEP